MDGVLLGSHGYQRALQETVRLEAMNLGYADTTLTLDEIAAFESVGMTSEWDEAAVSSALLQIAAWSNGDGRSNLATRPDFGAFALSLGRPEFDGLGPLERAARAIQPFLAGLPAERQAAILERIAMARHPLASPTHRIFQELVLGSQAYEQVYKLPAAFRVESYLLAHDVSYLDTLSLARFNAWLNQPGHQAAIMTSRPNRPPADLFGTPEAELGAQLVGLSHLPIVGWGSISWLAEWQGIQPQSVLKPDGVHALAAIQMAMGVEAQMALVRAYAFNRMNQFVKPEWQAAHGGEILVFEDTMVGLHSAQAAQATLERAGITVRLSLHGICTHPVKQRALEAAGARVHSTLAQALQFAGLA
jgi:hypothetical protein